MKVSATPLFRKSHLILSIPSFLWESLTAQPFLNKTIYCGTLSYTIYTVSTIYSFIQKRLRCEIMSCAAIAP